MDEEAKLRLEAEIYIEEQKAKAVGEKFAALMSVGAGAVKHIEAETLYNINQRVAEETGRRYAAWVVGGMVSELREKQPEIAEAILPKEIMTGFGKITDANAIRRIHEADIAAGGVGYGKRVLPEESMMRPPAGAGDETEFSINPATAQELARMREQTAAISESSQNVVKSFWSVWSITWMIRGTLQNIFGYSTKWVGEVNKLTRAFQSGLYMYAGMNRIADSLTKHILTSNSLYKDSLAIKKTIAYIVNPSIARLENQISLSKVKNLDMDKKEILELYKRGALSRAHGNQLLHDHATREMTLVAMKAQTKELTAQAVVAKADAYTQTQSARNLIMNVGMKLVSGIAVAAVALGVLQWITQMNTQVNTARKNMRELRDEVGSLGDATSTVKTSFSSVSDLVDKITKNFPEMTDQFNAIRDPAEKIGLAFQVIAENAAKGDKWTFRLKENVLAVADWANKTLDWMAKEIGLEAALESAGVSANGVLERANKTIKEQTAALHDLFTAKGEDAEKTELMNMLLSAHNKSIKDNLASVEGITAAYERWKDEIVETIAMTSLTGVLDAYGKKLDMLTEKLDNETNAHKRLNIEMAIHRALVDRSNDIDAVVKDVSAQYSNLFTNLIAQAENAAGKADIPMTWLEYYTQMYEMYGNISEKDTTYTTVATKYKQLLTKALNDNIAALNKEIATLKQGTEEWKTKNIELGKSIEQLTDLNELMDKLNEKSTWFNIPSAIIKPTASQLTGSTIYMSNEFHLAGKATQAELDDLRDTMVDVVNQANNARLGTVEGAL